MKSKDSGNKRRDFQQFLLGKSRVLVENGSTPSPGQGYAKTPAEALAKLRNETKVKYWQQPSEVMK